MTYSGYACLKTRLEGGVLFVTIGYPPMRGFLEIEGQTPEVELNLRPLSERLAE